MDLFEFLFFTVCPVIGLVTALTLPWLPFFLWKKLIPKAARTLFWAKRRNKPPIYIVHDSGRSELTLITERRGSGVVTTETGKYKLLPRYVARIVGKKKNNGEEGEDKKNGDKSASKNETVEYVRDYSDYMNKRSTMIGLGLPFFVGYSGKLCLLNPEALALYEAGEMMVRTEDKTMFNPRKIKGKEIGDALQPLLLLEPRKIKNIISSGFDETQIAAIVADSELIGYYGRPWLKKYLPIIGILIIVGAGIAALVFLPQILGVVG